MGTGTPVLSIRTASPGGSPLPSNRRRPSGRAQLTVRAALLKTAPSARWGASCPRQGNYSHPIWFVQRPEPSSGLYQRTSGDQRKEGLHEPSAHAWHQPRESQEGSEAVAESAAGQGTRAFEPRVSKRPGTRPAICGTRSPWSTAYELGAFKSRPRGSATTRAVTRGLRSGCTATPGGRRRTLLELLDASRIINGACGSGHTGLRTRHFGVRHGPSSILVDRGPSGIQRRRDAAMPCAAAENQVSHRHPPLIETARDGQCQRPSRARVIGWATSRLPQYKGKLVPDRPRRALLLHLAVAMGGLTAFGRSARSRGSTSGWTKTNRRRRPLHLAVVRSKHLQPAGRPRH
jgi:hypothetical protein